MKCLVIGNGPSLKTIPLSFLYSFPSLGSNRIYLLEGFTPNVYACVNPLVCKQSIEQIKAMRTHYKYIRQEYADQIPGSIPLISNSRPMFSFRPDRWVYEGYTVTFVLLQLALFRGYDEVGLIGVDHRYEFDGKPNQKMVSQGDDPNHFSSEYFGKGTEWHNPDLKKSEHSYGLAKAAYKFMGGRIVNLTPGSALDVFDKEDWKSWYR